MSEKSFKFKTDARKKKFIRLVSDVHAELAEAIYRGEHNKSGTKAELARKLGINKSVLSRRLNGTSNMTLLAIADIAWATDCDINFKMTKRAIQYGCNRPEASTRSSPDTGKNVKFLSDAPQSQALATSQPPSIRAVEQSIRVEVFAS